MAERGEKGKGMAFPSLLFARSGGEGRKLTVTIEGGAGPGFKRGTERRAPNPSWLLETKKKKKASVGPFVAHRDARKKERHWVNCRRRGLMDHVF